MDKYLPGIAHMNDIIHAINFLIVAFIGATGSAIVAYLYQWRVSLPRRFEQQTKEREAQLADLKQELENKHAAQAVDIERERMFPVMVENNQRLVESMIKSKDADTAATLQRIELDKTTAAVLIANTNQLTTHSDRLEETTDKLEGVEKKLGVVEDKVEKLYKRFLIVFPRESNILELFDELKGVLEETKQACTEKKKGDSQPLPTITLPTPTDAANILYSGVEPDDLRPTGTG
jgi:hypothetical protein